jgi:hypothetical protein
MSLHFSKVLFQISTRKPTLPTELYLSQFSSGRPRKCWDSTSNQILTASFRVFSSLLFFNRLIIWRYINWAVD